MLYHRHIYLKALSAIDVTGILQVSLPVLSKATDDELIDTVSNQSTAIIIVPFIGTAQSKAIILDRQPLCTVPAR